MIVTVLDTNLRPVGLVENYETLIWNERYDTPGDFELTVPPTEEGLSLLQHGHFLEMESSPETMIIESVKIEDQLEDGDLLVVAGRDLSSILDRRIVWKQTNYKGSLSDVCRQLLHDCLIAPTDSSRRIDNFKYTPPTFVTSTMLVDTQYTGDNLLKIFEDLSSQFGVGFAVRREGVNFVLQLQNGSDLSGALSRYVEFSPDFDNLQQTEYSSGTQKMRTVALVAGEGEGLDRRTLEVNGAPSLTGLLRRETFVDARDISSDKDGVKIQPEQYNELLHSRGVRELALLLPEKKFTGKSSLSMSYVFRADYNVGDIVMVRNAYGVSVRCRITEYIISRSRSELVTYPVFESLEVL